MSREPTTLIRTPNVLALRLNGRPRDPLKGEHKRIVVYAGATMTAAQLAVQLRDAADRLELLARTPDSPRPG